MSSSTADTPEVQALHSAFDQTGFSYSNKSETLALFKQQVGTPVYDTETDSLTVYRQGKNVAFTDALKDFTVVNKDSVLKKETNIRAKEELTTVEQKTAFIEQFGFGTFENLPAKPRQAKKVVNFEDYSELTVEEKAALADLHGADWARTLPRRAKVDPLEKARRKHIDDVRSGVKVLGTR